jgi:LuxR family maltose regulon positive regulatory protein
LSGAVDTIVFEWNDFTLLDRWIGWLDDRLQRDSSFPSIEIEARVASSMAGALLYRQPYHPRIKEWMERALSLCQEAEDVNLRMKANLSTLSYYAWIGDLSNCNRVAEEIRKIARLPTSSPLMVLTWKWIESLIYNRTAGSSELSLLSISEGLEIARKQGVHVWDHMLLAQGVYASLNRGDMAMAGEFLKKMEMTLEKNRRHGLCQYYYLVAWCSLLANDISRASFHAETALRLADETGVYFTKILCSLLMAQVLYEKEEYQKATSQLSLAKELIRRSGSAMLEYMRLVKEAQFAIDRGTANAEKQGLEALRSSMELGQKHGYAGLFPWWQRSIMARLCAKALVERIEVDYVQDLIKKHHLIPDDPPVDIENWPWPLKIYTLGQFKLVKDGDPVTFSGKVQQKPLEMLKALIAFGGREVTEGQIDESLWPDADGDAAHHSFEMTLHRLRRLIGHPEALQFQDGSLTLNPRYYWVDVWAFESILGEADGKQKAGLTGDAASLIQKAIEMYRGPFLSGETEEPWVVSMRERLRSKFLRSVKWLGHYWEQAKKYEKALEFYQRGLEVDDLAEELYRRLMICHQRLGQKAEALSVYNRCKKILSTTLGIEPSPETQAIYKSL